ncbi:PepSY domain-containing protein [Candidatus Marithrix sp. Canyon 246]|uniref:PepSY domain-containing protein n=2 Tax=Candidatus Marithrix sp. Canyon 246 TaxID=1827136 RepID=UPI00084A1A9B|nr:PepSY domain-containing protein [Candidatus Marithrix sp. Canyon 246]
MASLSAAYPVTDKIWISSIANQLYLNKQLIQGNYDKLAGAVNLPQGFIAILIEQQILLITAEAEIIEALTATEGLPIGIGLLGLTTDKQLIAQTPSGLYKPDDDFMTWEKVADNSKLQWIKPQSPPSNLEQALIAQVSEQIIPLERLLLDLHSGRLFGIWGVYVMDLVAILILILAATGLFMWLKRKRR